MTALQAEVNKNFLDTDPQETQEWIEALDNVIDNHGSERTAYLIDQQIAHARTNGVLHAFHTETPYINTISVEQQPPLPGDQGIELQLRQTDQPLHERHVLAAGSPHGGRVVQ